MDDDLKPKEVEQEDTIFEDEETTKETLEPTEESAEETTESLSGETTESEEISESEFDETGIPYKNRYMEQKRKYEKLLKDQAQPEQQQEQTQEQAPSQPQKYTTDQLEAFVEKLDFYDHEYSEEQVVANKAWAKQEIAKLQENKTKNIVENTIQKTVQQMAINKGYEQSLEYVKGNYPQMLQRDNMGRFNGQWNNNHPMTQRVSQIWNNNKELQNNPRGLYVATELAYSEMSKHAVNNYQQESQKMKTKIRNLEKSNMIEGNGKNNPVIPRSGFNKDMDSLRRTGSFKDAKNAVGDVLRRQGFIDKEKGEDY